MHLNNVALCNVGQKRKVDDFRRKFREEGLTAVNLGQEKDGAILKRPDVDISSDQSAVHECHRRTDMPLANPKSFLYSKYVIYQ